MDEILLLPRLHPLGVRHLLSDLDWLRSADLDARIERATRFLSWASSGGSRASDAHLKELRDGLGQLADDHGFPAGSTMRQRAAFDAACAAWLVEKGPVTGGEALRDDIWAFVACCIAPDICAWRFEGAHPERFAGGVRNTFQRLWLRGRVLDTGVDSDDRWKLVRELPEDATVQIVERPSIAADSRLARAIAEAWVATLPDAGAVRMEGVTRAAVRQLRITNEIICLAALDDGQLQTAVRDAFASALASLRAASVA